MNLQDYKILVVDDSKSNIDILLEALGDDYEISVATDGFEALESIKDEKPDMILLDVMMPMMDGYSVCEVIKSQKETKDIIVIFITAMKDVTDKTRGFELGAVDYITKPFEIMELQARVKTHLSLKNAEEMLKNQNKILEDMVKKRTKELYKTQAATIYSLAALAETRDPETGEHIKRTQHYVRLIAMTLREMGYYKKELTDHFISLLFDSSPLHDIGKVGVPDTILLKPGKLTKEEFEEMKKHTLYGMKSLEIAERELGSNSFLSIAKEIAYSHHEKWDGSGYPENLKEENIPLSGRIMALADVYDALTSERVYKEEFSHEKSKQIILDGDGTHFDPKIIEAFLKSEEKFITISKKIRG